jgi:SagB-type dehydrogenase family enzyme
MNEMTDGVGDRFQKETKYCRDMLRGRMLDWARKPEVYKEYPSSSQIELPAFKSITTGSVDEALRKRRSIRHFTGQPLTAEILSYLLWAAAGIQRVERGHEFRTAPSAGALYPIETYLYVDSVGDIESGIYHYAVKGHRLEQLRLGQFGSEIMMAALGQKMCLGAPVVFIWTAVFPRSKWKYEDRAYRYIYLDAGHIAENLALAATAIGLGTCQIGALFDDEANGLIGVDGTDESVIYMSTVGHPAGPP